MRVADYGPRGRRKNGAPVWGCCARGVCARGVLRWDALLAGAAERRTPHGMIDPAAFKLPAGCTRLRRVPKGRATFLLFGLANAARTQAAGSGAGANWPGG